MTLLEGAYAAGGFAVTLIGFWMKVASAFVRKDVYDVQLKNLEGKQDATHESVKEILTIMRVEQPRAIQDAVLVGVSRGMELQREQSR